MSFNSFTYNANKYARMAWDTLSVARGFKTEGLPHLTEKSVKLARAYMRLSLSSRRMRKMQKEHGW